MAFDAVKSARQLLYVPFPGRAVDIEAVPSPGFAEQRARLRYIRLGLDQIAHTDQAIAEGSCRRRTTGL
jgi:hypothetical protein